MDNRLIEVLDATRRLLRAVRWRGGRWPRDSTSFWAGYRTAGTLPAPGPDGAGKPSRLEAYFDANTDGPGLWKWRHYFPIYERHLGRFVGCSPVVVEIGVFSGGSVLMWHEFFGPGARLHGVDIEPACRAYETPVTRIHIGDQSSPAFWEEFKRAVPRIDVVLDDGGHEAHQQIPTLEALLPHLRPGGVYLCEDIHGPSHAFHDYIDGLSRALHAVAGSEDEFFAFAPSPAQAAIESVTSYPFVVVIEKQSAAPQGLEAPRRGTEWQPFYNQQP
jgi:hypothetical protein